jgi:hypothetical protein
MAGFRRAAYSTGPGLRVAVLEDFLRDVVMGVQMADTSPRMRKRTSRAPTSWLEWEKVRSDRHHFGRDALLAVQEVANLAGKLFCRVRSPPIWQGCLRERLGLSKTEAGRSIAGNPARTPRTRTGLSALRCIASAPQEAAGVRATESQTASLPNADRRSRQTLNAGLCGTLCHSHSASTQILSEWLLNSGAYMHWMPAKPV